MVERRPPAEVTPEGLRVGDVERSACVDRLTSEMVAGRLDEQEFDERVQEALRAQTRRDLADLIVDLDDQDTAGASGRSVVRQSSRPVVALSARDLVAAGVFTVVVGVLTFFVGMQMDYGDRVLGWLLLWLFGTVTGAVGAFLGRSGSRPR